MVAANTNLNRSSIHRRLFIGGMASTVVLGMSGCATVGNLSYVDAVRRLLELSARNAFARLTEPDGFWDSAVARIYLPEVFGRSNEAIRRIFVSNVFREKLQHLLNKIAEKGARRAAPIVADAIRAIRTKNGLEILRRGPGSATAYLRDEMNGRLVEEMFPELFDSLRIIDDPIIREGILVVAGADLGELARSLAFEVDDGIWRQIGHEETLIRKDPESSGDPELIEALKAL